MKNAFEWGMTILACIGLAMVATSCATVRQPPCVSACGMLLEQNGNGAMSCDVIQDAEDKMLDAIDKELCSKDKRMCREHACGQLFGWQILTPEEVITMVDNADGTRTMADGVSNCRSKVMELMANQDWRHGAFPHEIFHVIQDCNSGYKKDGEDREKNPGHDGWKTHGMYDLINDFKHGRR